MNIIKSLILLVMVAPTMAFASVSFDSKSAHDALFFDRSIVMEKFDIDEGDPEDDAWLEDVISKHGMVVALYFIATDRALFPANMESLGMLSEAFELSVYLLNERMIEGYETGLVAMMKILDVQQDNFDKGLIEDDDLLMKEIGKVYSISQKVVEIDPQSDSMSMNSLLGDKRTESPDYFVIREPAQAFIDKVHTMCEDLKSKKSKAPDFCN